MSRSGCMTVRPRNIQISLRSTARSRNNSAPKALREDAREVLTSVTDALLTELPSGEVDEDRLQRGFLDADVLHREAFSIGVRDDLRKRRSVGAQVRVDGAVDDPGEVDARYLLKLPGECIEIPGGVQADLGIGPDGLLERRRGVEREQAAVIDDRDPLAQLVGFFHVVRREHDRLAAPVQLA